MSGSHPDAPPAPRLSAFNVVDHPEKGSQAGVIAKRTYLIRNGRCVVSDEQEPLVEVPATTKDEVILTHDLDTVLNRKQVDVILAGKARTAAPARSFDIRVRVGGLERLLRVFGPRRCYRTAGQLRFSEPEPVKEMDVDWTSAY